MLLPTSNSFPIIMINVTFSIRSRTCSSSCFHLQKHYVSKTETYDVLLYFSFVFYFYKMVTKCHFSSSFKTRHFVHACTPTDCHTSICQYLLSSLSFHQDFLGNKHHLVSNCNPIFLFPVKFIIIVFLLIYKNKIAFLEQTPRLINILILPNNYCFVLC